MAKLPYSEAFLQFFRAYPVRRQNPMAPAAVLFDKKVKAGQATAEELTHCARAFAAECKALKIDPQYIPHTRTWLSQDRWHDYLPREEPAATEPPIGASAEAAHPLAGLLPALGTGTWRAWILPLVVEVRGGVQLVVAPTRFHAEQVRTRYVDAICRVLNVRHVEVAP